MNVQRPSDTRGRAQHGARKRWQPFSSCRLYELVFRSFCQRAATLRVAYQANPSMPGGRRLVEHTQETHPDGGHRLSRPYTHTVPHKQPTAPTCEHPRERGYGGCMSSTRRGHALLRSGRTCQVRVRMIQPMGGWACTYRGHSKPLSEEKAPVSAEWSCEVAPRRVIFLVCASERQTDVSEAHTKCTEHSATATECADKRQWRRR